MTDHVYFTVGFCQFIDGDLDLRDPFLHRRVRKIPCGFAVTVQKHVVDRDRVGNRGEQLQKVIGSTDYSVDEQDRGVGLLAYSLVFLVLQDVTVLCF